MTILEYNNYLNCKNFTIEEILVYTVQISELGQGNLLIHNISNSYSTNTCNWAVTHPAFKSWLSINNLGITIKKQYWYNETIVGNTANSARPNLIWGF